MRGLTEEEEEEEEEGGDGEGALDALVGARVVVLSSWLKLQRNK